MNNCKTIAENREYTKAELAKLGFETLDSKANFIFTRCDKIGGEEFYLTLKKMGILVRHFTKPLISDYVRITIGTKEQMDALLDATKKIIEVK